MKIPKKNYRKHQTFIYDIIEIKKEIKEFIENFLDNKLTPYYVS